MNRLQQQFAQLGTRNERALICYLMAGDPSASGTLEAIRGLVDAGVDGIELGIPFSDPLADGPTIQAAGQRALAGGMTTRGVLDLVGQVRTFSQVPLVIMTYANPVFRYGLGAFARDFAAAGADATIVTDLSPEESDEWCGLSREYGLGTVFLVAPTSTDGRIQWAAGLSTGFVYCVARTGVTGAAADGPTEASGLVARVRQATSTPACVGFGISRSEHVAAVCGYADGAIVGSALVGCIADCGSEGDIRASVYNMVMPLKRATLAP